MDSKHISKNIFQLLNILLLTILTISCDKSNEQAELFDLKIPLGLDSLTMFIPEDNPLTIEKIKLGRKLFFDERLSIDGTVSCATCHNPLLGFADGRSVAVGIEGLEGPRSTYKKAQLFNPQSSNILVNMGRVYSHLGQIKEARDAFNQALRISPGLDIARQLLNDLPDL